MANDEARVRFHAACHSEWFQRSRSGGAAGAGARELNLSEANGRDVCAVPTLPVWPARPRR